jgi:hypothetical protein
LSTGLLLPQAKLHLKTTSTTDAFEPTTVWIPTIHCASLVVLLLILSNRSTNFRIRTGIQTATTDPDAANDPLNPADVATYINTVSRNLIKFDPRSPAPTTAASAPTSGSGSACFTALRSPGWSRATSSRCRRFGDVWQASCPKLNGRVTW